MCNRYNRIDTGFYGLIVISDCNEFHLLFRL